MKKILICLTVILCSLSLVNAVDITGRDKLYLDGGLGQKEELTYAPVESIIIAPIVLPEQNGINSDDWIRGLYYYSTVRLGYADIPFDYIVLNNGKIYKTSQISFENEVQIEGVDSNAIVVGYLASKEDSDINTQARSDIRDLVLKLANENNIEAESIDLQGLRYKINLTNNTSTIETTEMVGSWAQSLKEIKAYVGANYSPIPRSFSISIEQVSYSEEELEPGSVAVIELTIKNTGENLLFADSESSLLITKKDGKLSKFFLNSLWASQSQVSVLSEGEYLQPGESKTFQVKFNVPLYFGIQEEIFVIKDGLGNTLDGTEFRVALNVGKLDATVVEILDTGTGYLNVRSADSGGAEVVSKVSPGERYILRQRGTYGYVQIDLGDGKLGWVSQQYVKVVN
ncbi:SH3 domain-containing protein [Candidatus Dojkabacteria bacterium]|nr:SH3 domain-containing protein [Candidatus Dojkabacteria bacterium]